MEGALEDLARTLSSMGYEVKVLRERSSLEVALGPVRAHVLLAGEREVPSKLYVRMGQGCGLTVVDCSDVRRVGECVKRLLEALRQAAPE